jgi:nucleotide-binding universal stress UspA family protein
MKEISTVIVPVDFLKNADKLIDYSVAMAEKLSAIIHFVHVVTFPTGDVLIGAPFASEYEGKMLTDAQTKMSNLLADNSERCPGCTGEVIIGEPVDKIVEIAKMKNADLIIISTHGAKGLEKMLLGSVAEHVLKLARCPVLVMNPFRLKWQMLQCVLVPYPSKGY